MCVCVCVCACVCVCGSFCCPPPRWRPGGVHRPRASACPTRLPFRVWWPGARCFFMRSDNILHPGFAMAGPVARARRATHFVGPFLTDPVHSRIPASCRARARRATNLLGFSATPHFFSIVLLVSSWVGPFFCTGAHFCFAERTLRLATEFASPGTGADLWGGRRAKSVYVCVCVCVCACVCVFFTKALTNSITSLRQRTLNS